MTKLSNLGLTRDKNKLEVEYEKLLTINETLAADLELAIRQKKNIQEEQVTILKNKIRKYMKSILDRRKLFYSLS